MTWLVVTKFTLGFFAALLHELERKLVRMVASDHYLRIFALTLRMLITADTRICGEVEGCNPFRTGSVWKSIDHNVAANQIPSVHYTLTLIPAKVVKWSQKS